MQKAGALVLGWGALCYDSLPAIAFGVRYRHEYEPTKGTTRSDKGGPQEVPGVPIRGSQISLFAANPSAFCGLR